MARLFEDCYQMDARPKDMMQVIKYIESSIIAVSLSIELSIKETLWRYQEHVGR